ncbi:MAG TPA: hypothetical protein VNL70_03865, partial [Tepidisphaeraceae bacterium]|nr:hypothetical protein [Tepidisphaeraceae bacterium]
MMLEPGSERAAIALMALAVAGLYLATRALDEALRRRFDTPGRRAMAWWVPTALVVIISLLADHPEIAVGVIFATSVACLTLVLPMIGVGSILAHQGRYQQVVSAQVGFVLLNLCGLLPLATTLWQTRAYWQRPVQAMLCTVAPRLAAGALEAGSGDAGMEA